MPNPPLCPGHIHGFSPSQVRRYTASCSRCVALYGHLPEGQRDRPAVQPQLVFANRRRALERTPLARLGRLGPPTVTPIGNMRDLLEEVVGKSS